MKIKNFNGNKDNYTFSSYTQHWQSIRNQRQEFISENFNIEFSKPMDFFWVDKDHPNGPEIHVIYDNALIYIYNERTKKLITILIARPGQITRYYTATNKRPPEELIELAAQYQNFG